MHNMYNISIFCKWYIYTHVIINACNCKLHLAYVSVTSCTNCLITVNILPASCIYCNRAFIQTVNNKDV